MSLVAFELTLLDTVFLDSQLPRRLPFRRPLLFFQSRVHLAPSPLNWKIHLDWVLRLLVALHGSLCLFIFFLVKTIFVSSTTVSTSLPHNTTVSFKLMLGLLKRGKDEVFVKFLIIIFFWFSFDYILVIINPTKLNK